MKKTTLTIKDINTEHFTQCIKNLNSDFKNHIQNRANPSELIVELVSDTDFILQDGMTITNISNLASYIFTINEYKESQAFSDSSCKLNLGITTDNGYSHEEMGSSICDEHLVMKTFIERYYVVQQVGPVTIVDMKEGTPAVISLMNEKQRKAHAKRKRKEQHRA